MLEDTTKLPLVQALRANAALSLSLADLLETGTANSNDSPDQLIRVATAQLEPFGLGVAVVRTAIDKGELTGIVGSRRRLQVRQSELIAWRDENRKAKPRSPRARSSELTGINEDPLAAMVRRGELRAVKGGKR